MPETNKHFHTSKTTSISREMQEFYTICEQVHFPPLDLNRYDIPKEVLRFVPERIARAYQIIPIGAIEKMLIVAVSDPFNVFILDNLRLITQKEISPVIAPLHQILDAIDRLYVFQEEEGDLSGVGEETSESTMEVASFKEEKFNLEEVAKLSKEAKIVKLVNEVLKDAVNKRASDIHIEPYETIVRVRFRIDGLLHTVKEVEKKYQEPIIARLKLMSRLDITQRKIPQDGRFGFKVKGKEIDVRVSILPVDFGEKIVMRLLDKASINLNLEKLGFSPYALEAFKKAIAKPYGMILLTGPTGSGKTTTLYTILTHLNTIERNIVTIEDPVEYNLAGITQTPVRHEIGLDFANILRATLRQSPDIIMVGEIRDFETVDIAMKAALTGHVVLSTLHTNDAPSAITRLLNMEVEPFLIASSLNIIAAQRLVRKLCPKCKQQYKVDLTEIEAIPERLRDKNAVMYKPVGCPECGNTGYKGRVAVIEALVFDQEIRDMVMSGEPIDNIRNYATKNCGMKSLREDAVEKALRGETSLEEVIRVTVDF